MSITEVSGSIPNILSAADRACYAAKDEGRNRVHVYHEGDAELARRHGEMQWVGSNSSGLRGTPISSRFQPIVPLDSGLSEGEHYELLIRMEDEEGRIVLPGVFLAGCRALQSLRQDRPLGYWQGLRVAQGRPETAEKLVLCAINLSGRSLGDEEFLEFIIRQFDETNVPPEKICFEITETAAIATSQCHPLYEDAKEARLPVCAR